jgi:uncharacterized protein (DUF2062 family)
MAMAMAMALAVALAVALAMAMAMAVALALAMALAMAIEYKVGEGIQEMSRFGSVKFDRKHRLYANEAGDLARQFEIFINDLPPGRSVAMAITKLEECHVWIGKAIRDSQIAEDGKE